MALQPAAVYLGHVKSFFESIRNSLPGLNNKGKLKQLLDQTVHPSFIYTLPNPTIATAAFDPLKKGLNNLKPELFYGLNSRLVVWAPKHYFNHLGEAAAVRCPLCRKVAKVQGWGQHLRRICALYGTFFLVGTRHICKDCDGLKAGKTFIPDEPGEEVGELPPMAIAEEAEAGLQEGTAAAAAAAAAAGTSAATKQGAQQKKAAKKQQQQQQKEANRQERQQTSLTFMSYDRQVLDQMPAFIREQVPFLTTAKGAIDTTLLQLLKLLAVSDVGFSTLVSRLQELHHWQYYKQMLVYYSFAAVVKEVERTKRGAGQAPITEFTVRQPSAAGTAPATFDAPPDFGNKAAAALYVPSSPWLTDVFVESTKSDREYMQLWQAALCGMILKLDHSFKVVKRVRDATTHKQFAAVLTVMNEFCQVLACFPAQSKSLTELEPELAKIMANYQKMEAAYEGSDTCGATTGVTSGARDQMTATSHDDVWSAAAAADAAAGGAFGWDPAAAAAAAAAADVHWDSITAGGGGRGAEDGGGAAATRDAGNQQQLPGRRKRSTSAATLGGPVMKKKPYRDHRCTQCGNIKKEGGKATHTGLAQWPGKRCEHSCVTCGRPMAEHTEVCKHKN